ncbi:MAG: tetratricopeptide repeat protein [Thermodesulfobacteriota bacterium]
MSSRTADPNPTRNGPAGSPGLLPALLVVLALLATACSGPGPGDLDAADVEYAAGNYFQAQSLYEEYLRQKPEGKERLHAWDRLLDIALAHNDRRRAASLMESMLLEFSEASGQYHDLLRRLAVTYQDLRDWDRALDTWQKLLAQPDTGAADQWEIHWRMGKIFQYQGQYAQARQALGNCVATAPDPAAKARCLYDLAQIQTLLKEKDKARASLNQILALDIEDGELRAQAAFLLADIYEAEGDLAKTKELLTSILQTYPNPIVVRQRLETLGK